MVAWKVADLPLQSDIIDVQHRYGLGIDIRDWRLYRSVFADRVLFDFTSWYGGEPRQMDADEWVARVAATQTGFDGTQHQMSNHRVAIDGERAECLTYVVARHYLRIGDDHHLQAIGGYYRNTLINEGGDHWRIDRCSLTVLWTQGDRELFDLAAARVREGIGSSAKGFQP
jgi:hypothetical protein